MLLPEAAELTGLTVADAAPAGGLIVSLPPRLLGMWPDTAGAARSVRISVAATSIAVPPPSTPAAPPEQAVALALIARAGVEAPRRGRHSGIAPPYLPLTPPLSQPSIQLSGTAPLPPQADRASRLSGSGWLALRQGGGASLGPGGQLGGSQAGVRLRYAIGNARVLALSARVSTPMRGPGREAALGIEWQPRGVPVAVIVEQRFGLDNTPGGPAMLLVGGLAPRPVAAGFDLEGYAQGGGVWRRGRVDPFVDGALRIAAPIANAGRAGEVTVGMGAWGGAQRGATRLDVGPSAAVALPIGSQRVRLSLDWRQRIAGRARPGSGLAITLGSDF